MAGDGDHSYAPLPTSPAAPPPPSASSGASPGHKKKSLGALFTRGSSGSRRIATDAGSPSRAHGLTGEKAPLLAGGSGTGTQSGTVLRRKKDRSPVIYTVIAKGEIILASHTTFSGTFRSITAVIVKNLASAQANTARYTSYGYESFVFHTLRTAPNTGELTLVALTGKNFPQELAYDLLEELATQFTADNPPGVLSAPLPLEMDESFGPFLREAVMRYNTIDREDLMIKHEMQMHGRAPRNAGQVRIDINQLAAKHEDEGLPPLLVQQTLGKRPTRRRRKEATRGLAWMRRHPNLSFFLSFMILIALLYFGVAVPICGWDLQRRNPDGEYVCWLS